VVAGALKKKHFLPQIRTRLRLRIGATNEPQREAAQWIRE